MHLLCCIFPKAELENHQYMGEKTFKVKKDLDRNEQKQSLMNNGI